MQPTVQMRDVWTVEDLGALEVEDWRRYEIVDGALVVSPPPGLHHEFVIADLRSLLASHAPPGSDVLGNVGVQFDRSYRIPDITVVSSDVRRRAGAFLRATDVLLGVEVVSAGSVTTDRVTKPAQYAAAGIAHYWRVETEPASLNTYALQPGSTAYAETGTWAAGATAAVAQPFRVTIEIDRLGAAD